MCARVKAAHRSARKALICAWHSACTQSAHDHFLSIAGPGRYLGRGFVSRSRRTSAAFRPGAPGATASGGTSDPHRSRPVSQVRGRASAAPYRLVSTSWWTHAACSSSGSSGARQVVSSGGPVGPKVCRRFGNVASSIDSDRGGPTPRGLRRARCGLALCTSSPSPDGNLVAAR
jgi:hypothetical protein